ncbi:MAG: acyl-CoA dehydrogenase family protein [Acidobacteriota bacterium]|nr:acyl-CoA dehydrogenase family protein [Acidobacteriota bacterium]
MSFIEQTPFFDGDHQRLAASVASFAWREIELRGGEEADSDQQFRDLLSLLAQADLLRYVVAQPGAPLDLRSVCLIREELAYASSLADLAFVMQGLGTYAINEAAPPHVRDFWLSKAVTGKAIGAFALTEPGAGSDVANIQTTAQREGDSYRIDGRKRFISNAGIADFYTVFARTGARADGNAEISAFVVGARVPGFRVTERIELIAPHPIGEIEFSNLRVPIEERLGGEGAGYRLAIQTLNFFRASVGAAACGMARRALDESIAYAKSRTQFGAPLAHHQLIQEKLAEMSTQLDAARLLVYRAAHLRDVSQTEEGASVPAGTLTRAASEAKLFATEAAWQIIDEAVQIHGGSGLVRGSVVERLYRDIRALRIYEGTSEMQKLVIARELLRE